MPAPQRKLHLTNSGGRDATVLFGSLKPNDSHRMGLPGAQVEFRRYLATTESGLHENLAAAHGEDYSEALVKGDPEVDIEQVGKRIGSTAQVFLAADGSVLHAAPKWVEIILGPDGEERERRDPEDREGNVNDELPVRWTGRKIPKRDAVRRFVFTRSIQLAHLDGLTYDYLYGIAQELAEADALMMMGAGPKGRDPLVFQTNGTPWRGFLEGRVDGARYMLILHLSNMELKRPAEPEPEDDAKAEAAEEAKS
ncbi:MAG: hypothetical protein CMN30_06335 [Sandaracinus sp.]|nr:hypothetical protein [Sandaracinus sp.]|tara:strand:- start:2351 stop:3109 length:759 start_codon:yes stop_codon:yes gene_type:complete